VLWCVVVFEGVWYVKNRYCEESSTLTT